MRVWVLAFTLGVIVGGYSPVLPPSATIYLLFIPTLISIRLPCFCLASAYCLGIFWIINWAIIHDNEIIPASLAQKDIWVYGKVSGLPQSSDSATRLVLETRLFCNKPDLQEWQTLIPGKEIRRLLLNDYTVSDYSPGEWWWLNVSLKRPHGFANSGGFDYEAWLFQQKITATGYIKQHSQNK